MQSEGWVCASMQRQEAEWHIEECPKSIGVGTNRVPDDTEETGWGCQQMTD